MRYLVSHTAKGREGNRKFQDCFDPIWLSEELGRMKGQDVGVGSGSEPACTADCASSLFIYLFSELIHVSSYQNSALASHLQK